MGVRTIGIDLAIRGDHVARILDDGRPHGKPIRFRLTSDSLTGLVAKLRDGAVPGSAITAVMEPTGMAWFPVARWLKQDGIRVIRVKGQRVQALRRYLSEHAKTDAAEPTCSAPCRCSAVHLPTPCTCLRPSDTPCSA